MICFVRSDRIPHHGCYDRGDIAGFAGPIADAIVAQGLASCTMPETVLARCSLPSKRA